MANSEKAQTLKQEEIELLADLTANSQDAGDYHFVRLIDALILTDKFWEIFSENDLPYTRMELEILAQNRQDKRNRIIEIRKELEDLENE